MQNVIPSDNLVNESSVAVSFHDDLCCQYEEIIVIITINLKKVVEELVVFLLILLLFLHSDCISDRPEFLRNKIICPHISLSARRPSIASVSVTQWEVLELTARYWLRCGLVTGTTRVALILAIKCFTIIVNIYGVTHRDNVEKIMRSST